MGLDLNERASWHVALVGAGTAAWFTDRYYEAGFDDVVSVLGHPTSLKALGVYTAVLLGGLAEMSNALYVVFVSRRVDEVAKQLFGGDAGEEGGPRTVLESSRENDQIVNNNPAELPSYVRHLLSICSHRRYDTMHSLVHT